MGKTHTARLVGASVLASLCRFPKPALAECVAFDAAGDVLSDLAVTSSSTGASVVSWSFPTDVCVGSYVVATTPLDDYGKVSGDTTYFQTPLQNTSVPELDFLRPYRFEVKVMLPDGSDGPTASTIAPPFVGCTPVDEAVSAAASAAGGNETSAAAVEPPAPGQIVTLAVLENDGGFNLSGDKATVCWTPPTDGVCVESYTLGRRMQARNDAEAFNESFQWQFFTFEEAGCHEIGGHEAGRTYDYGVRGTASVRLNEQRKDTGNATESTTEATTEAVKTLSGPVTAAQVFLTDAWKCVRGGSRYELCAGAAGQCSPFDCAGVKEMGLCEASFVRKYDMDRKLVVQYCSDECSCSEPTGEEVARQAALAKLAAGTLVDDDFACCDRWGGDADA